MTDSFVIDIGGTYCRFAIMDLNHTISCKQKFLNYAHENFLDIFQSYFSQHREQILNCDRCCIAVAGPVNNGVGKLTNINWTLDAERLQQDLPFKHVALINDFHALGYCIPLLSDDTLLPLQQGKASNSKVKTIVGAGTGLGVAHIRHHNHFVEVHPSEGGHVDFAPASKRQIKLLEFLLTKYQHVSIEHILSGHGIEHLYEFICLENNAPFDDENDTACDISGQKIIKMAMEQQQPLAIEAVKLFSEIYAAFIGNVALHDLPYGGIYISGGIAQHILPHVQNENFIQAFHNKGRLSAVLKEIPLYYIMNHNANLLGAGYYISLHETPELAPA